MVEYNICIGWHSDTTTRRMCITTIIIINNDQSAMAQHNLNQKEKKFYMRSQLSWHYGKMHCNSTWTATSHPIHVSWYVVHVRPLIQRQLLTTYITSISPNISWVSCKIVPSKRECVFIRTSECISIEIEYDYSYNVISRNETFDVTLNQKSNHFWPKIDT